MTFTYTYIFFPILIFLYYLSIAGFGKFFLKITNLEKLVSNNYNNLELFFGLIFIGFFSTLINFKYNLNDIYSTSIVAIGLLIYLFFL